MWLRCITICVLANFGLSRSLLDLESPSPASECTDTLHVYDPLPGVGLGHVAASHAAVMETFARAGVKVSIHDCTGEIWDGLRAPCTTRVSPSLVEVYSPASDDVCGVAPPPGGAVDVDTLRTRVKSTPGFSA